MNPHIDEEDRAILDIIKDAVWVAAKTDDWDELPNWRRSEKWMASAIQLGNALTELIKQYRGK
jgi:hypothetical protein